MNIDFDVYITPESMAWCEQTLQRLGHPMHPTPAEFFTLRGQIVPQWYYQLVHTARSYQESQAKPILSLASRPFVDCRKEIVTEICQAINLDRAQWPHLRPEEI